MWYVLHLFKKAGYSKEPANIVRPHCEREQVFSKLIEQGKHIAL